MSETSNTELIASSPEDHAVNCRAIYLDQTACVADFWPGRCDCAVSDVSRLRATLTETEADLQASRGRENALLTMLAEEKSNAWWRGVSDQWTHRPIGNRILESANPYLDPSRTLEAVKADATTEWGVAYRTNDGLFVDGAVDRADAVFRTGWHGGTYDLIVSRQVTEWVPVETEGESRG